MTPEERKTIDRLIDDLEQAHHDRDDKQFDLITGAARTLLKADAITVLDSANGDCYPKYFSRSHVG